MPGVPNVSPKETLSCHQTQTHNWKKPAFCSPPPSHHDGYSRILRYSHFLFQGYNFICFKRLNIYLVKSVLNSLTLSEIPQENPIVTFG